MVYGFESTSKWIDFIRNSKIVNDLDLHDAFMTLRSEIAMKKNDYFSYDSEFKKRCVNHVTFYILSGMSKGSLEYYKLRT